MRGGRVCRRLWENFLPLWYHGCRRNTMVICGTPLLSAPRRPPKGGAECTHPLVSPAGRGGYAVPTPWSRLPARSVRGRAPPALTHPLPRPDLGDVFYLSGAGGRDKSIISFQRGAWRPPLWPPTVYSFASQRKLSAMGVQGGAAPLKILLNIKNKIPLPRQRGNRHLSGMGAGGGRGVGSTRVEQGCRRDQGVDFL